LSYEECFEVPFLLLFAFGSFLLSLQLFNYMGLIDDKVKEKISSVSQVSQEGWAKKVARVEEAQDR